MPCPYKKQLESKDGKCPVRECPEFKKYFEKDYCKCGKDCKCKDCKCNENTNCPYLQDKQAQEKK